MTDTLSRCDDGDISIDFASPDGHMLSIRIEPDGECSFAWRMTEKLDGHSLVKRGHATAQLQSQVHTVLALIAGDEAA